MREWSITMPAELHVELKETPQDGLLLRFQGAIEQANPGAFLDPLLEQVHQEAQRLGLAVTADFTGLGFLNSSGIKSLIKWVMKQMCLPEGARYGIKFLYARHVTWQATSLTAITHLARGSVIAEPVQEGAIR
jgi:hypothetical protein